MSATVISLATRRVRQPDGMSDLEKQDAIARLRRDVPDRGIVYVVPRETMPRTDALVCDFFLIDGPHVQRITDDIAHALGRTGASQDVGLKLVRAPGRDPLTELIDGILSRLLFGERDRIYHQVIR